MNHPFLPKLKSSTLVYQGFFDLQEDILEDNRGQEHSYCSLKTKADGVVILPETSLNHFLLTHEYRHPLRKRVLSCPGGRIYLGEDPLLGAKRELQEELGYEAHLWIPMGHFYPFPSACDQKVYLYLARDLQATGGPTLDPLEEIESKAFSWEELLSMDISFYSLDGVLTAALFLYQRLIATS